MSQLPSIRTGLTIEEIKQDFREHYEDGKICSDRSIRDYYEGVWNIKPGQ